MWRTPCILALPGHNPLSLGLLTQLPAQLHRQGVRMMEKVQARGEEVPTPTFLGSAPKQASAHSLLSCHFASGAKVFPQMGTQGGGRGGNDSPTDVGGPSVGGRLAPL